MSSTVVRRRPRSGALDPAPGRTHSSGTVRGPVAVIDIGSNSGRVMVYERDAAGHLRMLAVSRASLRLVRDVDERGAFSETTMAGAMVALSDFKEIAMRAGAVRIRAVATAATRDARNGEIFTERVRRELGIVIDVIDGLDEARYGFAGAVRGLCVSDGILFDLGGGSVQITRFQRRRIVAAQSLPLGALRLSEHFLESDPPTRKQLRRLHEHVNGILAESSIGPLRRNEVLVGTGGTIRNLARMDLFERPGSLDRVHGYVLALNRLRRHVEHLAATRESKRDEIPGLSDERADSVVGGAVAIERLAAVLKAPGIVVSGQGLREGIAIELLGIPMGTPASVREAALDSLVSRFDGWTAEASTRRRHVTATLLAALHRKASPALVAALDDAARVLDIGRSVDVLHRHEHVANILAATDLVGFTHAELAILIAIIRRSGDRHATIEPVDTPSGSVDENDLDGAAVMLALADELEARAPRGPIVLTCDVGRQVTITVPSLRSWRVKDLDRRFERCFGRRLVVKTGRT